MSSIPAPKLALSLAESAPSLTPALPALPPRAPVAATRLVQTRRARRRHGKPLAPPLALAKHAVPPAIPRLLLFGSHEKVLALLVNVTLAALSTFEYVKVAYDKCFGEFPKWHLEHMTNIAVAPLQYRVLSFLVPEAIHRFGVPIAAAYVLERGVFLAAAGVVFHRFCRRWLGVVDTLFATTALFFYYTLSAFPHIQPSEEPNLFFFALGLLFIHERRFVPLLFTLVLGTFDKETVAFLIPLYVAWEAHEAGLSRGLALRTALLGCGVAVVYVGIRLALGTHRLYLGGLWQFGRNLAFIPTDPLLGLVWVLPSLAPAAWIVLRRQRIDPFFVAFLPSLALFTLGHFAISRVDEFRTYAPLALVTFPACIVLLRASPRFGYRRSS
jgi:hypothetical protein